MNLSILYHGLYRGFPALLFLTSVLLVPAAFAREATIHGSVADPRGHAVAEAQVKLMLDGRGADHEAQSGIHGDFTFSKIPPGPYSLSFQAAGFATRTVTGELKAGETLHLGLIELALEAVSTSVDVSMTQAEVAQVQIREAEQQRLIGMVPNFFTAYDFDAVPLNTKQKLELSLKTWLDPASFVIGGIAAGVGQARNTYPGFGQGAQGYAKRYGAGFADFGTSLLIERVVATTLFKQDPRYFYKGTGTAGSRAWYAISRTVICRGDNKKFQPCYSSLMGQFAPGFVTNNFYPESARNSSGVILQNSAIGLGFNALGNLFQEFLAKKMTRKKH